MRNRQVCTAPQTLDLTTLRNDDALDYTSFGRTVVHGHIPRPAPVVLSPTNVLPLITMQYVILFPLILQIQAALGFLGLGVQPPTPDWGAILQQGKDAILFAPWLSLFPGLTILVTALGLSLIGQTLQARLDRR